MKKVVFGLMILLMMAFQCESPEEEYGPEGHWYIKNQTDNVLRVSISGPRRLVNGGFVLPDDSVEIHDNWWAWVMDRSPSFRDFSVVDSISIYDYDDGVELQKWIRAESEPGQYDIFDESQWSHYVTNYRENFIWTFSVSNGDSNR